VAEPHRNGILNGKQNANLVTAQSAFRIEVNVRGQTEKQGRKEMRRRESMRDASAIWRKERYIRHV